MITWLKIQKINEKLQSTYAERMSVIVNSLLHMADASHDLSQYIYVYYIITSMSVSINLQGSAGSPSYEQVVLASRMLTT